jgi:beta-galactosidase beta subunit
MTCHELSTWEEVVREFEGHQYYSIQLIIRKAQERIDECDPPDLSDTPFDDVEDLIAGYKEVVRERGFYKMMYEGLK